MTPADTVPAGRGYALNDNKIAASCNECDGIAPSALTSGTAAQRIVLLGKVDATFADSYGAGAHLSCTASGYFTLVDSGLAKNALSLEAANSGINGEVFFSGAGHIELA